MSDQFYNSFIFNNPTKIFFGRGKLDYIHSEQLPGRKALLLTSSGKSCFKNGSFDKVIHELKEANVDYIHIGCIKENPLKDDCEEAGHVAMDNNCDFVIALGGGAVLDAAVPVSILAKNGGDLWDYVNGGTGKGIVAMNNPIPIITIPTTSGTGSEVNECGVISREDTYEKIGMSDKRCKPVMSFIDPTFMKTVPPNYTAYQGLDAFFHHAEAMMSKKLNIMSERIALSSIADIYSFLPKAVENGCSIEARERVAFAATMSGFSMQLTRITAQHSMEHAMSAYHRNLPHGAGLIMIAKEFAKFFIDKHVNDSVFIKMASCMGFPGTNNPYDYIKALEELMKKCDVSGLKMSEYGIVKEEFDTLIKASRIMQPGGFDVCPCVITDEDVRGILERSYR